LEYGWGFIFDPIDSIPIAIIIPDENEVKEWIQVICEYFETAASFGNGIGEKGESLLSRKQIVGYLDNISLVMLHAWMKQGSPYHKQGRAYFLKSEALEYIKTRDIKISRQEY